MRIEIRHARAETEHYKAAADRPASEIGSSEPECARRGPLRAVSQDQP